ncbi:MAG: Fic family protein [Propionibacteriaceae bacterium]|jgi:Fic family protein|nr:Fic family protein [Propionibacteriaceae bacterium]
MATFEKWMIDPDWTSPYSEERRGGMVRRYRPDFLCEVHNVPSVAIAELAGDVASRITAFGANLGSRNLGLLYATLLKSESISSSQIEGYKTPPSEVVLAEFAPEIATTTALTIRKNVLALQESLRRLNGLWTSEAIHQILVTLLPNHPEGYRSTQVRIGGRSLFRAAFVPPPAEDVSMLMDDLIDYANRGPESIVTKAGVVHAQFETIHPYNDGNGRTGRALVHALFARAGLLPGAVLPVSTVLRVRSEQYIGALTQYRYDSEAGQSRQDAVDAFVQIFAEALNDSVTLAQLVAEDVATIEAEWSQKTAGFRADSTAIWALRSLVNLPALTIESLAAETAVTKRAASRAISKLVNVGILVEATGKYKKASIFLASQVLDLLTQCERRAASPDFDTKLSQPAIPAPLPVTPLVILCSEPMPRAGTTCVLNKGHMGRHRSQR